MLTLIGRNEPREGRAWLTQPEPSDVFELQKPWTTVKAAAVRCPQFPIVLERIPGT